jgi:hypothetical protein
MDSRRLGKSSGYGLIGRAGKFGQRDEYFEFLNRQDFEISPIFWVRFAKIDGDRPDLSRASYDTSMSRLSLSFAAAFAAALRGHRCR